MKKSLLGIGLVAGIMAFTWNGNVVGAVALMLICLVWFTYEYFEWKGGRNA